MKLIQESFNEVLKYSQKITTDLNTDELFKTFEKNKNKFIQAFNGYVYEIGDIDISLDAKAKESLIDTFLDDIYGKFEDYYDIRLDSFVDFINCNRSTFFKNRVGKEWINSSVKEGDKLSKAFKYFFNNENKLREAQDLFSTYQQKTRVKGTLCLSVHPLDFISISDNAHNWRSCHALNGDYRAGNLNYMADKSTVIAYIKSDKPTSITNFPKNIPWNSKKWRMLVYVNENGTLAAYSKQYPFEIKSLLVKIEKELIELNLLNRKRLFCLKQTVKSITTDTLSYQHERKSFSQQTLDVSERRLLHLTWNGLKPIEEFIKECPNPLFFNDLLRSSTYYPYLSYTTYDWDIRPLEIGETFKCVACGKGEPFHTDCMLCSNCALTLSEEEYMNHRYCGCCKETRISTRPGKSYYDDDLEDFICINCARERGFIT